MKFIAGSNSYNIAKAMSDRGLVFLNYPLAVFFDGELQVSIREDVFEKDVIIVQSTFPEVNNTIFELALIADTLKRLGARSIQAIIPYLSYSRQDHPLPEESHPLELIGRLFKGAGIEKLFCFDLHSERVKEMLGINVVELSSSKIILPFLTQNNVIISPDRGGINRVRKLAALSQCSIGVMEKKRYGLGGVTLSLVEGEVVDRDCYIIDDMIDGGSTIIAATNALLHHGARSVSAFCTHPILSGNAVINVENSSLQKLLVTNTIDVSERLHNSTKIKVLDIVDLLVDEIVHADERRN